jgi:hypothetical protein
MGVLDPRLQSLLATRAHHEELVRKRELAPEDAPETAVRVVCSSNTRVMSVT